MFVRNAHRPEGVWVRVKAGPLRDGTGSVRGGLSVIRDVTKQKEAERRLAAQYAVTRVPGRGDLAPRSRSEDPPGSL